MSPLRAWRLANGLSLQDVSDLSGISVSMISRVERGQKRLSPLTKAKVARRLGVRIRDLFEVEEISEANVA
ncbi:helix-turn-helix transcriptional regulator [Microbispora sp. SCL1-1]|uniref:helix-turn-helix domain-containing protein n=1 Tax=unclassified Microbispora TaxID=2614687 RepID=UPI00115B7747|nr:MULTISPECIES: helix-turn-helix transcriptional regulator [unclassified Microbispora]NJP28077.1 helix-turn-helix transcriptional regulator [Microbispora sp. CL1-1]TQS09436.1 helix-turn-helix transcriptional regulator [Microbispora sp. SCL1-1]